MKMKVAFVAILVVCLIITSSFVDFTMASSPFCNSSCGVRCAKAGVQDRCMKYCGICCEKCKCVPSGTYGRKHECPCYRDMVNNKGKPKCP